MGGTRVLREFGRFVMVQKAQGRSVKLKTIRTSEIIQKSAPKYVHQIKTVFS